MFPLLLLFLVGGAVAAAVAKSGSGSESGALFPSVNAMSIAKWESRSTVPADKLNTHGQKFIDPCGIARGAKGYESVMSLPSDGKARMTYVHNRAQSTIPHPVPASDILMAAAGNLGIQAAEMTKKSMLQKKNAWIDKMREYSRLTANGYVIAFAELTAALMRAVPVEWDRVYQTAKRMAAMYAEEIASNIVVSIAYGAPYPMHVLDDPPSSVKDLGSRSEVLLQNLGQFVTLPAQAKELISSWFALLATSSDQVDVQRAIIATDDTAWGKANLASDDQVYLAAAVFASSIGEPVLPFAIELWNRAQGWSRWKGLATNTNLTSMMVTKKNGVPNYNQSLGTLGWSTRIGPEEDTGYTWAFDCVQNARMLNWLDIILTGWSMVAERSGKTAVSEKVIKLVPIA